MQLSDIKTIGIAGGGTMGFGIGLNFALGGYPTIVYDIHDQILETTELRLRKALKIFVDEGLITEKRSDATLKLLTLTSSLPMLADTDFITEAIVERLSDKQQLFNELDKICPPQTIIASNTSSLLISDIGEGVKRSDKIVLTHYFDPPHIVPGVEVAKGNGTSDETFNVTYDLLQKVKKVPIKLLKEIPGYLLNTIQREITAISLRLWAEGIASAEDIDLGIRASFGFRNPHEGPFMHADLCGAWKWPKDIQDKRIASFVQDPKLSVENKEFVFKHYPNGKLFLIDPEHFEEAIEARDREYARRLKDLYWGRLS